MAARSSQPDLDGLSTWQVALTDRAEDLRAKIIAQQADLAQVEERLTLVTKLIEVETRAMAGTPAADGGSASKSDSVLTIRPMRKVTSDLEDAVEEILRDAGKPLHISAIRETLMARGVPIPGRGDDANIIVRLRRVEERFTRTARGTYGLAEWKIPALKSKPRKARRTTAQ